MKKFFMVAITLLALTSCEDKTPHELSYTIFYPRHNETHVIRNNGNFYWGCDRGNNYIKYNSITGRDIYSGSAPYKINYYIKVK